jgi:phosphocarrier protein
VRRGGSIRYRDVKEVTLIIRHEVGLHARPAVLFVQTASNFKSNILVTKDDRTANAKSILSILTLGASQGAVVTIRAEGEDEAEAIEALGKLVESNFGEEGQVPGDSR